MSIVALKRKTEARYGPHSVPGLGFSLNGTTRFQGPNRNSFGRSVIKTPFRGTEPMGHGGGTRCRVLGLKGRSARCDNTDEYPISIHHSCSAGCTPQDLVKKSVLSTNGYFNLKNMVTLNKNGCHWVKPEGLDVSDLPGFNPKCEINKSLVHFQGATCKSAFFKTVGTMPYSVYNWRKEGKARFCGAPNWPPRVNNSHCAPVWSN